MDKQLQEQSWLHDLIITIQVLKNAPSCTLTFFFHFIHCHVEGNLGDMLRKYNTIQVRSNRNLCLEKHNEKYTSSSFAFRSKNQFMGKFWLVKVLITLKLDLQTLWMGVIIKFARFMLGQLHIIHKVTQQICLLLVQFWLWYTYILAMEEYKEP